MRTLLVGVPHNLAQPVCDALNAGGVQARVVRPFVSLAGYGPTPPAEIVILNDHDTTRAMTLAAECMLVMSSPQPDQPDVDLSRLPPALRCACPDCNAVIDPRSAHDGVLTCPACGTTHDAVDLVIDQHGPEAFELCTDPAASNNAPPAADQPESASLMHATVACTHCGYALEGLARRGICPECGQAYDKALCVLHPYLPADTKP